MASVKNTFIHVSDPAIPNHGRVLRRCCTDPEGQDPIVIVRSALPVTEDRVSTSSPTTDEVLSTANSDEANDEANAGLLKAAADEASPATSGKENLPPMLLSLATEVSSMPCTPESSPRRWPAPAVYGTPPRNTQSSTSPQSFWSCGSSPDTPMWHTYPQTHSWSLPASVPPPVQPFPFGTTSPSPVSMLPGIVAFSFSLRRADDTELGIDVRCGSEGRFLVVQNVLRGGAVESWNRQCLEALTVARAIFPGDTIVSVNGLSDCKGMLDACRRDLLVKLVVARAGM